MLHEIQIKANSISGYKHYKMLKHMKLWNYSCKALFVDIDSSVVCMSLSNKYLKGNTQGVTQGDNVKNDLYESFFFLVIFPMFQGRKYNASV